MDQFSSSYAQKFLDEMRQHEYRPGIGQPCTRCHSPTAVALARCRDCLHSPITCIDCITQLHAHNPLHFIETWDVKQQFFSRCSLGIPLHLGHDGEPCPAVQSVSDSLASLLVVHTNGIHSMKVTYCQCNARIDHPLQLFSAGFFPASFIRPSTAFTLAALKEFNSLHSQAYIPASDYLETINQRSSDDLLGGRQVRALSCHRRLYFYFHSLIFVYVQRTDHASSSRLAALIPISSPSSRTALTIPRSLNLVHSLFGAQAALNQVLIWNPGGRKRKREQHARSCLLLQ
jgi:hypothetical protein